ncbi:PTS transporter subunit EIIB [Clostridium sp. YIM B02555]|jgi:phosphotransferase system IIB component|uniref:PTS transporter subunit EIIB n=1 Tax=Clostridium sp. YIM B02555 TaxID=2911968 RepID=UPI001EEF3AD6|nr:PTS transporter subunit EIIB [Clostridium sp. YIM B02555]
MNTELTKSAEDILGFIGYEDNIVSVGNCTTRLRLNLRDKRKVDVGQFKKVEGVLGIVETKEQLQIILEPKKAKNLITEFKKVYEFKNRI